MKSDRSVDRVRFGPFEADFSTQELWKHGIRLKLGRQPFEVLEMLVSRPGELVLREDLERRLWPDGYFVDASHGLNAAINKLRETLGDSVEQPLYIETLHRRGYRFIGEIAAMDRPVQIEEQPIAVEVAPVLRPPVAPMLRLPVAVQSISAEAGLVRAGAVKGRSWPLLVTAAMALVVGSFIGVNLTERFGKHPGEFAESERFQRKQIEEQRNTRPSEMAVEPVGRAAGAQERKAGGAAKNSDEDMLPQREGYGSLQMAEYRTIIPGDAGNAAPQFSPDGKKIAFMSNRSGPWQIWMSNVDGSDPVQVSFTESAGTPRWSPDGQSIAFDAPMGGETHVFVAPVDRPREARALATGRVPSFSRDGNFLYFASERGDGWQVWKVPAQGGEEVELTKSGGFAALESPDGNVYYAKTGGGNPELWMVPAGGGVESLVSPQLRPRTWSSWTVTNGGILLVGDARDGKAYLSLYNPVEHTQHDLASLQIAPHWMGATADGKKVVMNDANERQITMLDHLR